MLKASQTSDFVYFTLPFRTFPRPCPRQSLGSEKEFTSEDLALNFLSST